MARVLVTGLQGFTGPYVAAALRAADHVVLDAAEAHSFDLRNAAQVAETVKRTRPEYVVHLAALSSVTHADAAELYAVNTVGTEHLLRALADHAPDVRKVLLASSANVYGNVAGGEPIDEDTPPAPVNHYACSKLAMEYIARTWFERLPIVITRPFNYTGVGQSESFLVPKLVAHYAKRRPVLELGNIDVERDFSDVRMVADAYARLLAADAAGTVVNVCSGRPRSLRSILEELEAITGHRPELRVAQHLVRRAEVQRLTGRDLRLRRWLGQSQHCDFAETLRWMVREL
ncbi:MAG: NAD-dependent epimerase/dehydratase family protein [Rubrivivax sp.]|nr:NAD-dependent epimerase/dehydratase family protein [Rubrivivax sp.]